MAYAALRPVVAYGRLVGVHPQSILYSILYSSLVFACSVASVLWLQFKDPEWFQSLIHLVIEKSQVVVVFANYAVALGTALWQNKNFQRILEGLDDAEKELSRIGVRIRRTGRKTVRMLIARVTALASLLSLDLYINESDQVRYLIFDLVSTYGTQFSVIALQLQAYTLLNVIGDNFAAMTTMMKKMQVYPDLDKLVRLLRVYDVLKQIALRVNGHFSLNILFSLISTFFYSIVTLHLVATSGIIRSDFTVPLYVFCIGSVALKLFEIWNILVPFVYVTDEVEKFNGVLFKLTVNDLAGKVTRNEKVQLHLSVKQGPVFTASGFFNLDYSLIQSIIGAITTFLVILVQFDMSNDPGK